MTQRKDMKKMDYEKMYKAVLETAKQWVKDGCSDKERICLECVFPELRESEDERIRKEMIEFLNQYKEDGLRGVDITPWISYLDKQKEQKPAEWSERDESIIEGACNALEIHGHLKLASMLKSIKPQWKPSEEQISALDCVAGAFSPNNKEYKTVMHHIDTLRNMLKQL